MTTVRSEAGSDRVVTTAAPLPRGGERRPGSPKNRRRPSTPAGPEARSASSGSSVTTSSSAQLQLPATSHMAAAMASASGPMTGRTWPGASGTSQVPRLVVSRRHQQGEPRSVGGRLLGEGRCVGVRGEQPRPLAGERPPVGGPVDRLAQVDLDARRADQHEPCRRPCGRVGSGQGGAQVAVGQLQALEHRRAEEGGEERPRPGGPLGDRGGDLAFTARQGRQVAGPAGPAGQGRRGQGAQAQRRQLGQGNRGRPTAAAARPHGGPVVGGGRSAARRGPRASPR